MTLPLGPGDQGALCELPIVVQKKKKDMERSRFVRIRSSQNSQILSQNKIVRLFYFLNDGNVKKKFVNIPPSEKAVTAKNRVGRIAFRAKRPQWWLSDLSHGFKLVWIEGTSPGDLFPQIALVPLCVLFVRLVPANK